MFSCHAEKKQDVPTFGLLSGIWPLNSRLRQIHPHPAALFDTLEVYGTGEHYLLRGGRRCSADKTKLPLTNPVALSSTPAPAFFLSRHRQEGLPATRGRAWVPDTARFYLAVMYNVTFACFRRNRSMRKINKIPVRRISRTVIN